MRIPYKDLMEKLGVGHILSPYETRPWFHYEAEQGITCSAEVRVGPGAEDLEAEIQYLYDDHDEEDEDGAAGVLGFGRPEQILLMRFMPSRDGLWAGTHMFLRGEIYHTKIGDWDKRGCEFFILFIGALQMGELPDVDELIEQHLTDGSSRGGGRRGRVSKKGFKVAQKPPKMGGM